MKKEKSLKPTPAELDILSILWIEGEATVRHVNDKLNEKKKVGYTTTLKIMQIMTDKGLLKRDSSNRSHTFRPLIKQQHTQQQLLDSLLDSAFNGSASKLVMQALGNNKTSQKELEQIRELLDELERGAE